MKRGEGLGFSKQWREADYESKCGGEDDECEDDDGDRVERGGLVR
jgi:hypothetical protein